MLTTVIASIILLGILIFIHELGHFIVAKAFGVGVKVFSLGFGKRIFAKRIGDTDYQITWFPLGGYVKMVGEEPGEEVKEEEKIHSFSHRPLWQRTMIVLAGPIFNLVFPLLIFIPIFMIGQNVPTTLIGLVDEGSPAFDADIRPGDRITAVNGDSIWKWKEMQKIITDNPNKSMSLTILREGVKTEISITPDTKTIKDPIFGEEKTIGEIGIRPITYRPIIGVTHFFTPAYRAGLRSGDLILSADGHEFNTWFELRKYILRHQGDIVRITFEREGLKDEAMMEVPLPQAQSSKEGEMKVIPLTGIVLPELFINDVLDDYPAKEAGLKKGDQIVSINKVPIKDWSSLVELIRGMPEQTIRLEVNRYGIHVIRDIKVKEVSIRNYLGEESKIGQIGITPMATFIEGERKMERLGPLSSLKKSFIRVGQIIYFTMKALYKLILGELSLKNIGGPILIIKAAGDSARSGFIPFLTMLILISINLGIINLFPIPMLDGGHLILFLIEFIRGKDFSIRSHEMIQRVGIAILVLLMAFAFFNDIMRFKGDIFEFFEKIRRTVGK